MREIKFRACISPRTTIYFDLSGLIHPSRKDLFSKRVLLIPWLLAGNKPDEYTGLHDKKRTEEYPEGQEIYEGDIVKFPQWKDYDKGLMGYGIGTVEWYDSDAAFEVIHDNDSDSLDNGPNSEVIGNIYENPRTNGGNQ